MEDVIGGRRRVAEVRVKLQPELLEAFDRIAARRGLPAATLGAVVLGEYVEKQGRAASIQELIAKESAGLLMRALLADPATHGVLEAASTPERVEEALGALARQLQSAAGGAGSSAVPEAAARTPSAAGTG